MTQTNKRFLLFDTDDDDRIICFSSDSGLKMLSECDRWHVDATFKACPDIYYQLLIIHAFYKNKMLPCVFILMKNNHGEIYRKAIPKFKQEAEDRVFQLRPSIILTDFELALINTFTVTFPGASILGCFFYFTQCIWKQVLKFGLKRSYLSNKEFNSWIKKLMCLPFVPLAEVKVVAEKLCTIGKPSVSRVELLSEYFLATWINCN